MYSFYHLSGYLFFIFCLLISLSLHSQDLHRGTADYEIIYRYAIESFDQENAEVNVPPGFIEEAAAAKEILSKLKGRLIFNHKSSLYWSPESLSGKNQGEGLASNLAKADHKYYYYHPTGILYIEKMAFGKKTRLIDDKTIVWEILSDQTVIHGLVCRKAIGTFKTKGFNDSKVEVWFAPDLPFPFGPVATYGLPGVILEYKLGNVTITAQSITKVTDGGKEIIIPDFGDVPSFSDSLR